MPVLPTGSSVPAAPTSSPNIQDSSPVHRQPPVHSSTITPSPTLQETGLLTTIGTFLCSAVEIMIDIVLTCANWFFSPSSHPQQADSLEKVEVVPKAPATRLVSETHKVEVVPKAPSARVVTDIHKTAAREVVQILAKACSGAQIAFLPSVSLLASLGGSRRRLYELDSQMRGTFHNIDFMCFILRELRPELKQIHALQIPHLGTWCPWIRLMQEFEEQMTRYDDPNNAAQLDIPLKDIAEQLGLSFEGLKKKFESFRLDKNSSSSPWEKLIESIMKEEIPSIKNRE